MRIPAAFLSVSLVVTGCATSADHLAPTAPPGASPVEPDRPPSLAVLPAYAAWGSTWDHELARTLGSVLRERGWNVVPYPHLVRKPWRLADLAGVSHVVQVTTTTPPDGGRSTIKLVLVRRHASSPSRLQVGITGHLKQEVVLDGERLPQVADALARRMAEVAPHLSP